MLFCRLPDEAQAGVALAGHQGHIELRGDIEEHAGEGVFLDPDLAVIRVGGRVPQGAAICPLRGLQQVTDAAVGAWLVHPTGVVCQPVPGQFTVEPHLLRETADRALVFRFGLVDGSYGCQLIKQLPDRHRLITGTEVVDGQLDAVDVGFGSAHSCLTPMNGFRLRRWISCRGAVPISPCGRSWLNSGYWTRPITDK